MGMLKLGNVRRLPAPGPMINKCRSPFCKRECRAQRLSKTHGSQRQRGALALLPALAYTPRALPGGEILAFCFNYRQATTAHRGNVARSEPRSFGRRVTPLGSAVLPACWDGPHSAAPQEPQALVTVLLPGQLQTRVAQGKARSGNPHSPPAFARPPPPRPSLQVILRIWPDREAAAAVDAALS